jgi:hypothetical protein
MRIAFDTAEPKVTKSMRISFQPVPAPHMMAESTQPSRFPTQAKRVCTRWLTLTRHWEGSIGMVNTV